MDEMHATLSELVRRAKQASNTFPSLTGPDTLPAVNMADELARIGGDFIKLSVELKQAGVKAAAERVDSRRQWSGPKKGAERIADALVKRGCYRVQL